MTQWDLVSKFSIYMDSFFLDFQQSICGCHLEMFYVRVLAYADEIFMFPSQFSLRLMLVFVKSFLIQMIQFIPSKFHLIQFYHHAAHKSIPSITFCGYSLSLSSYGIHLGHRVVVFTGPENWTYRVKVFH